MEFLFSGQWLDESNKGAPFSNLSCPAMVHVCSCVGVASQKFCRDHFSWFGWCPPKPQNLITLRNLYPYSTWTTCYVVSLSSVQEITISMNYLPVGATFAVGHGIVVVVDVIKVVTVGRIIIVEVGEKPVRSTQCIILLCIQLL